MILIFSHERDAHASEVERRLRARERRFVRISPQDVARTGWLSARTSDAPRDLFDLTLATAGHTVNAGDVDVVWLRRLGAVDRPQLASPSWSGYAATEWNHALDALYEATNARWVPGRPQEIFRADVKLTQLARARRAGFRVPATLLTSNMEDLLEFYELHNGRIISKLPSSVLLEQRDQPFVRFTHRVTRSDLGYLASSLRRAPCLFQERIEKKLELRVTVVGDRVFSAAIDSTRNRQCLVDSRRLDMEHTPHRPYPLDVDTEARLKAIVRGSGLVYATLDFVVQPDGELVFLELNPAGQYLWIEQLTGLPITDAICDQLVGDAPTPQESR